MRDSLVLQTKTKAEVRLTQLHESKSHHSVSTRHSSRSAKSLQSRSSTLSQRPIKACANAEASKIQKVFVKKIAEIEAEATKTACTEGSTDESRDGSRNCMQERRDAHNVKKYVMTVYNDLSLTACRPCTVHILRQCGSAVRNHVAAETACKEAQIKAEMEAKTECKKIKMEVKPA